MLSEYTKFKVKRRFRKLKRRGKEHGDVLQAHAHSHIFRRFKRLRPIRGFVIAWVAVWLVAVAGLVWQWHVLSGTYTKPTPVAGGTFVEGMVGAVDNINPVFAIDGANAAAAKLVFNGLLRYGEQGELTTDLAESITPDETGTRYTVILRDDVMWHDGVPLSTEDVAFTFKTIQEPSTKSPFLANWQDVEIIVKDDKTIEFVLPNPFAPFPHSLVTGIVPRHLLGELAPNAQRSAEFNQKPIGSGPFRFSRLDADRGEAVFIANKSYFKGTPKLERFVLRTFEDSEEMISEYKSGVLSAMAEVPFDRIEDLKNQEVPMEIRNTPTAIGVFAFYKTTSPLLSDKLVRQALTQAIRPSTISASLGGHSTVMRSPLLPNHLGYDKNIQQVRFSRDEASSVLDRAGWALGTDGKRHKNGQPLKLTVVTQDTTEYRAVSETVKENWEAVGATVDVHAFSAEELQKNYIKTHNYEVLVYGIDLGGDPDVYVYWHSSQAGQPGLNLSEYKNSIADDALGSARIKNDGQLRAAKYKTFLEQWRNDVPAAALYNRYLLYAQTPEARTFEKERLISPAGRYSNVETWTVRIERK